jgi:hypothetical protein
LAVPADQNFESSTTAGNLTNNITIGGVTYSTNGTGSPDVFDYVSFYLDPNPHLTGNVLVSDINSSADGTMTYVQFSNADGSNFKLNSLAANAWTTAAGFSQVFTITGYDGGSTSPVVVSVTGFDFQHSGTYGIGNAAITYTKDPDPNGYGYGVGLLTFGSAWDRIDTVRFTETDGLSAMLALDSLDFSPPTAASGPSVASINRAGASSALTNASSVAYTVTYSESVTGVDASDFVLTTTGTAGGTIASISGSGTTYTVTVNSLSGDGTLRLDLNNSSTGIVNGSAQAITGGFNSGQTYTLDTTAPTAPSGLDMTAGSDSGISNTDNITSVTTPTINGGGAEAGATVKLYDTDGTTLLGTTTADGSGNWSITTSALTDGAHTLKAKVTDAAGNTSTASTALSVTVDTVAPTAIALNHTSVTEADTGTSSTIASLSSTDSNAVTYALVTGDGTNDANNSSFSISGTSLQTNAALSAGTYNIKVSATDAAGNVTHQSLTITVTNQQTTQLVTPPPPQQPPRVEPTPQIKAVASPEVMASPTASSFFNQSKFGEKTAITIDSLLNSLTPVANDKVVETASRAVSIGVRSGSGEIFASGLSAINKLAEMEIPQGEASTISLPAGTFVHTDATARVSLLARLADGKPLPSYVKFNPTTGTFTVEASNRPPVHLQIRVIAVDDKGKTANTTVVIKIKGKSKSTSSIDVLPISGKMAFTEQLRNSEKPSDLMSHLAALNKAFEASNASRSHS